MNARIFKAIGPLCGAVLLAGISFFAMSPAAEAQSPMSIDPGSKIYGISSKGTTCSGDCRDPDFNYVCC
jgi:hypothetical protein